MERKDIQMEVDHILDSGANSVRFVDLIERLLDQESAIAVQEALRVASEEVNLLSVWTNTYDGKKNIEETNIINIGGYSYYPNRAKILSLAPKIIQSLKAD